MGRWRAVEVEPDVWMVLWVTEGGANPQMIDGIPETAGYGRDTAEQLARFRNERR